MIVLSGGFFSPISANAQVFYWDNTVTNGAWNDSANWQGGQVPNAVDISVNFENFQETAVSLQDYEATFGSLSARTSVTLGSTSEKVGIINLETMLEQPLLRVGAGTVTINADVTGTKGFRKEGDGCVTFRFNTNTQIYSGNITLAGGALGISQDGSLGQADNDIVVEATSTLQIEPSDDVSPVGVAASRDIWIASGAALTIDNSAAAVVGTVRGSISGDGSLVFGGTGSLILNGTNTYAGATLINSPGFGGSAANTNIVGRTNHVSFASPGSIPANTPLTLNFGSRSAINSSSMINVNLGGNAITPTLFAPTFSAVATASTNSTLAMVLTNGSLTYTTSDSFAVATRGAGFVNAELTLPETVMLQRECPDS